MVGNDLRYVPYIIQHNLRQSDSSSSASISIHLLIESTLELYLHQSLADLVLAAIVASDNGTNGIPKEGVKEDLAVVGGKRVEGNREWILSFLRELPIRLHAYYERINAKPKKTP